MEGEKKQGRVNEPSRTAHSLGRAFPRVKFCTITSQITVFVVKGVRVKSGGNGCGRTRSCGKYISTSSDSYHVKLSRYILKVSHYRHVYDSSYKIPQAQLQCFTYHHQTNDWAHISHGFHVVLHFTRTKYL